MSFSTSISTAPVISIAVWSRFRHTSQSSGGLLLHRIRRNNTSKWWLFFFSQLMRHRRFKLTFSSLALPWPTNESLTCWVLVAFWCCFERITVDPLNWLLSTSNDQSINALLSSSLVFLYEISSDSAIAMYVFLSGSPIENKLENVAQVNSITFSPFYETEWKVVFVFACSLINFHLNIRKSTINKQWREY